MSPHSESTDRIVPTRRKRCSECGELRHDVLGRQRLCEKCEEGKDYCTVCDEWEDRSCGDGCRHVQWSNECGCNCGCGSDHVEADAHRESFLVLLKHFAPLQVQHMNWDGDNFTYTYDPMLPQLLKLIDGNRFWTQWHGPLIGGPPDLALRYSVRGHDWCPTLRDISATEQLEWGEEAIDQMQLGMSWLTSLDKRTKAANRLTAKWMREFMRAQEP